MADSNFIFNLAFKTEGGEEVNRIRLNLDKLVAAQQRITSTSRQQGVAQKSLTEENKLFARATELSIQKLDRQRATLKKGSVEYARNNKATAVLQNSLNSLNTTNDRYNSTVIANQKREQRRKEALIASSGATQKLEQETKSFISSLGQSTSMTERNINEANQLVGSIDKQISANQKLQRTVGLTRKQQSALVKEEQRLIKTKESLQNRVSTTNNRFEQFKRTASVVRADLQRLSADNLRAGETTESHTQEQQRLERVLEELSLEFKDLSESTELSEQQMAQMSSTLASVKGAALQTDRNIKGMSNAFSGQTKATNSANQILLSFGDIAQDSAQFQFGFAQGMRAIGNNVTFAAEQFTIFAAKVAAANDGTFTMRDGINTLRKSLMGVGGLIILLNIAVTAVTVLSSAMRKNKKEAEETASKYQDLSSELDTQIDKAIELRKEVLNLKEAQSLDVELLKAGVMRAVLEEELDLLRSRETFEERMSKLRSEQITLGYEVTQASAENNQEKIDELGIQGQALKLEIDRLRAQEESIRAQDAAFAKREEQIEKELGSQAEELSMTAYREKANQRLQEIIRKQFGETTDEDLKNKAEVEEAQREIDLRNREAIRQQDLLRAQSTRDELKRIEEVDRVRRKNLAQRAIDEQMTAQEVLLAEMQIEMDTTQALNEFRDAELERERERKEKLLEIEREHAELRLSIEQQLSQSRQQVNQQLVTSLQSSFSSIFGQNKAVALLNLAVEKGLAIAKVMADSKEKASELQAEAAALRTKGAIAGMTGNPVQSGQFFAAAATATAGAVKTMAVGKKNAAKIAAIGLLQGAGALSGGGGGAAGGGGGGATGGGSTSFGTSSEELSDRERLFGPRYLPSPQMQSGSTTIIVETGYTQDGELAFNAKKSEGRLDQSILSGNASVIEVS